MLAHQEAVIHLGILSPRSSSAFLRHSRELYCPGMACFGWGLPRSKVSPRCGRAPKADISPCDQACAWSGIFSVALSVALRPPAFRWHPLLRSPDFPLPLARQRLLVFPKGIMSCL